MNKPILFVDEKLDDDDNTKKRYESIKELLYSFDFQNDIEFIGDLEIESIKDTQTEKVTYMPNPVFRSRKIVFIHAAKDDTSNKFSSDMVEVIKSLFPSTVFAEFSGAAKRNLDLRDLRFRRKEDIYKDGGYKLLLFVAYFKKHSEFIFDILVNGEKAFELRKKVAKSTFDKILDAIKNETNIFGIKADENFEAILKLAGLDEERISKGIEYVSKLRTGEEYIAIVTRYLNIIENECKKGSLQLNSVINDLSN